MVRLRPREEFLREASEQVRPVHAEGVFTVGYRVITYYLLFEYYDPLGYYDAVLRNRRLLEEEVAKLHYNMQSFIDQEEVIVNGKRVRPKVVLVDITFRGRKTSPLIVFGVRFAAPLKPGVNVYENRYESETVEYDYVAYWMFPPGTKILEVDMDGEEWEITETGVLAIYGRRGKRIGGYEKIVFELPSIPETEE
ncbi:hypothetical protein Pyrfu_0721 [Pyrolobus fumarii 1A]|uniref:Uncharacterized protein n=1 Tax=Pyrolobus fumarii (strain DSM 11204 / 1A) TaxID=694429 RepID=G0ED31_PYRF1|nr:hypothetical protein [Pyrolobus fumarii]AEM38590.1 hypothetical protein Pyrfu_0721 [Pyrolobus fumarii 1A]